jgi:GH15 family glucan-1,4-alpha-glucosidase
MKNNFLLSLALTSLFLASACSRSKNPKIAQSLFKLTTSNGLIVAVYDAKDNMIVDAYPYIFANYDSGLYVFPFAGNIKLNSTNQPVRTYYLDNTHIINVDYKNFSVSYFSSFTRHDNVLYAVIRGKKENIEQLDFSAEKGEGTIVSNISLLENSLQDLPIRIKGNFISGDLIKPFGAGLYEKYFLFSFTDSLHKDKDIIENTISDISAKKTSLVDDELNFMKGVFSSCSFPREITKQERDILEQSVTVFKMSQVSDYEVFPYSHGQVMAALRPGLWHNAWVRDGCFTIQAMTRLGMFGEARKALEFMLNAPSGRYKDYIYKDGKNYGPGVDYQVSLTRYFGNGKEECDYNEYGPNIEFDDFGLFLTAFSDFVERSGDTDFLKKWEGLVSAKVADPIIAIIDTDSLIRADSGPWEHHLQMPRKYTFTTGVCARGLELYGLLLRHNNFEAEKYLTAALKLKAGLTRYMLTDNRYFRGNSTDTLKSSREYYDAGSFEIFANGLFAGKELLNSHVEEYDKYLRIKGERDGYIRLNTDDPYENQEWVFIDLRLAVAYLLTGQKEKAEGLIAYLSSQASANFNTIPEMISNRLQMEKVPAEAHGNNIWCNCIRDKDDQYIGEIPMVGYGAGAYVLSLFEYYGK